MKKIAIILPGTLPVPPVSGGAVEQLTYSYLLYIAERYPEIEIDVFSGDDGFDDKKEVIDENVHSFNVKTTHFMIRAYHHLINRICKKYRGNAYIHAVNRKVKWSAYTLVIVENVPEYGIFIRKQGYQGNLLLHIHNDYINDDYRYINDLVGVYDCYIAVSRFIAKRIKAKIKNTEIIVVYNGLDTEMFKMKEPNNRLRSEFGIGEDKKIILYAGRITYDKGVSLLIDAFKTINNKKYVLMVIGMPGYGKGQSPDSFMNTLKNNCPNNVIWLGYIPHTKIAEYYQSADLGVVPSLCNEAFGLTLLEHLLSGHITICSNMGGLPEIMPLELSDYVVDATDINKFVQVIAEKITYYFLHEEREKNRINIRELERNFSIERYNKHMSEVINLMI